MSANSVKGYTAEHEVELVMRRYHPDASRPRAGRSDDVGDIAGIPIVISVKNHREMRLASWVAGVKRMVAAAKLPLGIVWHKKIGKGKPEDWYVTMDGATFLQLYEVYIGQRRPK
jgi:hypothetical protein